MKPGVWWFALATMFLFMPRLYAHVAPSENTNNRYIKLTPLGDRVRLSYTVYMGQRPGALARLQLDTNRDGVISDAEAEPFATQIGTNVAAHLEIAVDGVEQSVAWSMQMVGLGTPTTNAGAFSVDLLGWFCLQDAAVHRVTMRDRFRVSQPGETELRLTESPGVRITRATLGAEQSSPSLLDMKWMGAGGPLETNGLVLEFTVDDATRGNSMPCNIAGSASPRKSRESPVTSAATTRRSRGTWWIVLVAAIALLTALLLFASRRRRARSSVHDNSAS